MSTEKWNKQLLKFRAYSDDKTGAEILFDLLKEVTHDLEQAKDRIKSLEDQLEKFIKNKVTENTPVPEVVKVKPKYSIGDKVKLVIDNYVTTITKIHYEVIEKEVKFMYYFKDDAEKEWWVWEEDIIEKIN